MTRTTGPDCVVMCNLINTYLHTYILRGYVQFNKYIHTDGPTGGYSKHQNSIEHKSRGFEKF